MAVSSNTDSASPPAGPAAPGDFASFYRATLAPLRRYLFRLLGNQAAAQDVAHDAYARVYPAVQTRDIVQPQAFLYTTARNLALDQLKRQSRSPIRALSETLRGEVSSGGPGVEAMVMAREEWVLLERAIEGLPPGCRRVLMLRMVERLSHGEIAERLNLARSSVEKHLMRAIRLLGDALRASQAGRGPKIVSLESRTGTDRSSP